MLPSRSLRVQDSMHHHQLLVMVCSRPVWVMGWWGREENTGLLNGLVANKELV